MNDTGDKNVSGWSAVTAEWKSSFSQCSACGDWPGVTSVPILLCVTLNNAVLKPNTVVEVLSTWGHCSMWSLTWPTLWVAAFISPVLPRNRDQIFSRATTEVYFCHMEFTFSSHAETKKQNKTKKKMPVFTMAPRVLCRIPPCRASLRLLHRLQDPGQICAATGPERHLHSV